MHAINALDLVFPYQANSVNRWCNLVNTTELSMCSGDAACLSNYFDHLLLCNKISGLDIT